MNGYGAIIVDVGFLSYRVAFESEGESRRTDALTSAVERICDWTTTHRASRLWLALEGGISGRREIFPAYKEARRSKERDEDAREVAEFVTASLVALAPSLGVRAYRADGWEADDVAATLAKQLSVTPPFDAATAADRVLVVTSDKDLIQLVRARDEVGGDVDLLRIGMFNRPDRVITAADFEEVVGFPARPSIREAWIAFQALVGDRSDGFPGVSGCGEKGAKEALNAYPDILSRLGSEEKLSALSTRTRNVLAKETALAEAALPAYEALARFKLTA